MWIEMLFAVGSLSVHCDKIFTKNKKNIMKMSISETGGL